MHYSNSIGNQWLFMVFYQCYTQFESHNKKRKQDNIKVGVLLLNAYRLCGLEILSLVKFRSSGRNNNQDTCIVIYSKDKMR